MIFGAYTLFIFTFVAMVFIGIAKVVLRKLGVDVKDIKEDEFIITNDITSPFSDDINNIGR